MDLKKPRHRTSVSLSLRIKRRLLRKAHEYNMSPNELALKIFHNYLKDIPVDVAAGRPVRYQKRGTYPKPINISMSYVDYEYFLNIRQFTKISISFLMAIALSLYLRPREESFRFDQLPAYAMVRYGINNTNHQESYFDKHIEWQILWFLDVLQEPE